MHLRIIIYFLNKIVYVHLIKLSRVLALFACLWLPLKKDRAVSLDYDKLSFRSDFSVHYDIGRKVKNILTSIIYP
jgi:hypothetical protein